MFLPLAPSVERRIVRMQSMENVIVTAKASLSRSQTSRWFMLSLVQPLGEVVQAAAGCGLLSPLRRNEPVCTQKSKTALG
jgi:hypothetical protein